MASQISHQSDCPAHESQPKLSQCCEAKPFMEIDEYDTGHCSGCSEHAMFVRGECECFGRMSPDDQTREYHRVLNTLAEEFGSITFTERFQLEAKLASMQETLRQVAAYQRNDYNY